MNALAPYIPPRREYKYLVTEAQAAKVRSALTPYCVLDRFCANSADLQYSISSLYFDTARFDLYWGSRIEQLGRMKVRVRGYGSNGRVFFEVKRKPGGIIRKSRVMVPREHWLEHLSGPIKETAQAIERDFRAQIDTHLLEPVVLVNYRREAWASQYDAYARVTFDRAVRFQPVRTPTLDGDERAWQPLDDAASTRDVQRAVILELKCDADSAPVWMTRLTEQLGLWRLSYSKFCTSIERGMGRRHPLAVAPVAPTW